MSFTITGTLKEVGEPNQVTEKMITRLFVIEKDGKYPEIYAFQLVNDRCDLIEPFGFGDEIEVSFNINCRAWNDKYFTNLNAWKIQPAGTTQPKEKKPIGEPKKAEKVDAAVPDNSSYDDLPF